MAGRDSDSVCASDISNAVKYSKLKIILVTSLKMLQPDWLIKC